VTPTPAPPVANIVVSKLCGPAPLNVHFDASSSTGETSYAWDFDDPNGGNRSDASVDHVFDGSRMTYNVTLIVTGPGGTANDYVTIAVPCS
jgi:PKD repeat protein